MWKMCILCVILSYWWESVFCPSVSMYVSCLLIVDVIKSYIVSQHCVSCLCLCLSASLCEWLWFIVAWLCSIISSVSLYFCLSVYSSLCELRVLLVGAWPSPVSSNDTSETFSLVTQPSRVYDVSVLHKLRPATPAQLCQCRLCAYLLSFSEG